MLRPLNQRISGREKFTVCNLPAVLQNWPKISAANSVAVAGHCAHVVHVSSSLFLLLMAPEKRKLERMKRGAVMLRAARQRFNGITLEKRARPMMQRLCVLLSAACLMAHFCATISRAMLA
jgi:hypothetical protein